MALIDYNKLSPGVLAQLMDESVSRNNLLSASDNINFRVAPSEIDRREAERFIEAGRLTQRLRQELVAAKSFIAQQERDHKALREIFEESTLALQQATQRVQRARIALDLYRPIVQALFDETSSRSQHDACKAALAAHGAVADAPVPGGDILEPAAPGDVANCPPPAAAGASGSQPSGEAQAAFGAERFDPTIPTIWTFTPDPRDPNVRTITRSTRDLLRDDVQRRAERALRDIPQIIASDPHRVYPPGVKFFILGEVAATAEDLISVMKLFAAHCSKTPGIIWWRSPMNVSYLKSSDREYWRVDGCYAILDRHRDADLFRELGVYCI